MNIHISEDAIEWFKNEMLADEGEFIRFYVRYGGSSPLHDSFSLGVSKEEPIEAGSMINIDNRTFFIEERDLWYFDGHDLHVGYNKELEEPLYEYKK
ncbi:HesB/YadR/YfhF family protein [Rossellomorea aquimaris]|uniref:HesB/YadR/YfhF family protein n=1 Tax=Rossellomorea aquimaris TaxID=189382 RepID=UPI001CD7883D|nr:HesB/YadR/YfhF family protein [Rossellomorea aquimaris]MCA1053840.1 HesB/YadR/YfhF family protein [Rossellomorea aquimaris]